MDEARIADAETLDLRGLKCPLPALLARRRLEQATPGVYVLVLADDPMAYADLAQMCRQEGFEFLDGERAADQSRVLLRRPWPAL